MGEWRVSSLIRLTPEVRTLEAHWIRGWMGPRVCPNALEKRLFS